MTANERLESLLNRAGQTISDLPQNHCGLIGRVANLVDIIDRMETALENVIGERDYLADVVERGGLFSCEMCALEEGSEDCCVDADFNETGEQPIFRVPEDWRADDETD